MQKLEANLLFPLLALYSPVDFGFFFLMVISSWVPLIAGKFKLRSIDGSISCRVLAHADAIMFSGDCKAKNVPRFNVLIFLQHSLILSMFVFKSIHNFKKG